MQGPFRREYPPATRLAVIALGAVFFGAVLPWLLAAYGPRFARELSLPSLGGTFPWPILGAVLMVIGLFFAIWSVTRLFTLGRGTPIPLMPPRELVVRPPYSYCRNPMAFGVILAYLGFALTIASAGAFALACLFAAGLIVYIKATEEAGLKARFGDSYLEYRSRTPFLIPRPW